MVVKSRIIIFFRRIDQAVALLFELLRCLFLFPSLCIGLLLHREVFAPAFYAAQPGLPAWGRHYPLLHFILWGAWVLRDPHPQFSQVGYIRDFPRLLLRPPVLNHVMNPAARTEFPLAKVAYHAAKASEPSTVPVANANAAAPVVTLFPQPAAEVAPTQPLAVDVAAPAPARSDFEQLWPLIAEDADELSRQVGSITPVEQVKELWVNGKTAMPVVSEVSRAASRILDTLPAHVDFMCLLPWYGIRGGAERLTERYLSVLASHYDDDRICVFIPDASHNHSVNMHRIGLSTASINEVMPNATTEERYEIFDRVITNLRPVNMHNMSSFVAWNSLREHGRRYRNDSKIFTNIFSDLRVKKRPVGYYHNFLPYMLDEHDGIICDNATIIERFAADFRPQASQMRKFHVVGTPIIGLAGGDPRRNLRQFSPSKARTSLWMSRIAKEKRIDVLNQIARRVSGRKIAVYGAILAASEKIDMALLDHGNIDYRGEFESLHDMNYGEFDSYIFTSDYEGLPIALLEAAMMGLPTIAPNVGGIREIIDQDTGWLVSRPDAVDEYVAALREIQQNPEEARRRVERAQDRLVEHHSLTAFIKALRAIPDYLRD